MTKMLDARLIKVKCTYQDFAELLKCISIVLHSDVDQCDVPLNLACSLVNNRVVILIDLFGMLQRLNSLGHGPNFLLQLAERYQNLGQELRVGILLHRPVQDNRFLLKGYSLRELLLLGVDIA